MVTAPRKNALAEVLPLSPLQEGMLFHTDEGRHAVRRHDGAAPVRPARRAAAPRGRRRDCWTGTRTCGPRSAAPGRATRWPRCRRACACPGRRRTPRWTTSWRRSGPGRSISRSRPRCDDARAVRPRRAPARRHPPPRAARRVVGADRGARAVRALPRRAAAAAPVLPRLPGVVGGPRRVGGPVRMGRGARRPGGADAAGSRSRNARAGTDHRHRSRPARARDRARPHRRHGAAGRVGPGAGRRHRARRRRVRGHRVRPPTRAARIGRSRRPVHHHDPGAGAHAGRQRAAGRGHRAAGRERRLREHQYLPLGGSSAPPVAGRCSTPCSWWRTTRSTPRAGPTSAPGLTLADTRRLRLHPLPVDTGRRAGRRRADADPVPRTGAARSGRCAAAAGAAGARRARARAVARRTRSPTPSASWCSRRGQPTRGTSTT